MKASFVVFLPKTTALSVNICLTAPTIRGLEVDDIQIFLKLQINSLCTTVLTVQTPAPNSEQLLTNGRPQLNYITLYLRKPSLQ